MSAKNPHPERRTVDIGTTIAWLEHFRDIQEKLIANALATTQQIDALLATLKPQPPKKP